ncbi:hypothetical protein FBR04_07510 [Betaproteobacteria bacterium PRO7]|jgi:hypothetical protein|nr:hypothetical protein [Betaproteobacteria bacterium PRO7]
MTWSVLPDRPMIDELAKNWRRGAVVFMRAPNGFYMTRPAVWVWDTPDGFGFVEPAYASPEQPTPFALHYVKATALERQGEATIVYEGPDWRGSIEANEGDDGDASEALRWYFEEYLPGTGRTIDEERERVLGGIER